MKKLIIVSTALITACVAQAAFETTVATDGAILKGGSATNVVQGAGSISVKDAGTDGEIINGGLRIGMLKFDLSGITGTVHAASVNLLQKEPDPYDFYVWTVDHAAPGQDWTEASATMESVLTSGLFSPQTGLWKAGDANLNLIGVKAFLGDGGASQYNWETYSSFKNKDLTTYINNAVADGSNTLTLVFANSTGANIGSFRGASYSTADKRPYLEYSYDAADESSLTENVLQIGGQGVHRDKGWNNFTATSPDKACLAITNSVDTNLVITVNIAAGNPADILNLGSQHIGVDSSARQTDSSTGRLSDDETVKVTVFYEDPNGSMLNLGMSGIGAIWGTGSSETTTVTDATSTTYDMIKFSNDTFVQGTYSTTGLEDLTKSNTNTWEQVWSATGPSTSSGVGAFAIKYLTGMLDPSYGTVALGSTWSSSADIGLFDQSASGVSATITNKVGDSNRRFFQRDSDSKFDSAPVQLSETVTVSFTAKIGSDMALNGGDRFFRGSFWDEGDTANNGLSFRIDYGNVGGTTMELGKGNVQSAGYIGSIGGTTNATVTPSNALVNQGDESDFVLKLTRTGATTVDLSLTQDDVTLTKSYTDFNFDSFDAIGFRMNEDAENHLIISNLVIEVTQPSGGSPYEIWAGDWGEDIGSASNDHDLDGLNNYGEYVFGGDPTDIGDLGTQPSFDSSAGDYIFSLVGDNSVVARVLVRDDLVIGNWSTNWTETVIKTDGVLSSYTNTVGTAADKKFIKLEVD